jgi:hypothetical protein
MRDWEWTPRAEFIGGLISTLGMIGAYWLAMWLLFG